MQISGGTDSFARWHRITTFVWLSTPAGETPYSHVLLCGWAWGVGTVGPTANIRFHSVFRSSISDVRAYVALQNYIIITGFAVTLLAFGFFSIKLQQPRCLVYGGN